MGGLWVDYNLHDAPSPGCSCSARPTSPTTAPTASGASALMQGLADGYFVIPLHDRRLPRRIARRADRPDRRTRRSARPRREVNDRVEQLLAINGTRTVDDFHRELGKIMWDNCGMARNEAGLEKALDEIPALREEFWKDVRVPGTGDDLNQALEKAGRVADFLEFGELMCRDALDARRVLRRPLPRGAPDRGGRGPARRRELRATSSAWEYKGDGDRARRSTRSRSSSRTCALTQRSYK